MTFHVTHRYGNDEPAPALAALADLLRELVDRPEDLEHGAVSLTHETEWCISVGPEGHVTFENLERGGPRHMRNVPDAKILELWALLAVGDLDRIEAEPWLPGYE